MQRPEAANSGIVDEKIDRSDVSHRRDAGRLVGDVADMAGGAGNRTRYRRQSGSIQIDDSDPPAIRRESPRDRDANVPCPACDKCGTRYCHLSVLSKITG